MTSYLTLRTCKKNAQKPKTCCYKLLQNCGASLKAIGAIEFTGILCPGYIENLENGNPKGSDTRKQKYEFQCVLLAKIFLIFGAV